jgi:hypothetical protein
MSAQSPEIKLLIAILFGECRMKGWAVSESSDGAIALHFADEDADDLPTTLRFDSLLPFMGWLEQRRNLWSFVKGHEGVISVDEDEDGIHITHLGPLNVLQRTHLDSRGALGEWVTLQHHLSGPYRSLL